MQGLIIALLLAAVAIAQSARPRIVGIACVSLKVSDLARSRAFYGGFLGFDEVPPPKQSGSLPASVLIKVNDDQYIEIAAGLKGDEDRLLSVAFSTDDARGMRNYIVSRGIPAFRSQISRRGDLAFDFHDPDGHQIGVVQYLPNGSEMRANGQFMNNAAVSMRIGHVGLVARNGRAALDFYASTFGFHETLRGSSTGTVLSWVNMQVPNGSDGVEFMLYKEEPAANQRGMAHHLCLEAPSVSAAVEQLQGKPYAKNYDHPFEIVTGSNRKRHVNLFDPDGTRIELMEPHTIDGKPAVSSTAPFPR